LTTPLYKLTTPLHDWLLSPGADAAEDVFKRDGKRLGNQARAKAGEIKKKTKQVAKNAQKKTIRGKR
jgi:hypothetical protein